MAQRMLGIGIAGTGRVAASHARAITEVDGVALRAVAEIDAARRAAFLQEHAAGPGAEPVRGYGDLEDLLAQDDVEVVIAALPHKLHAPVTIRALQAGKHVLVEKPMAITLDECDAMLAAARQAGRYLAVGLTHHFHPVPAAAKALLDSGRYGRIVWATERYYQQRRYGTGPLWLFDRAEGGGQLLANAVHFVDRLCWTIGSTGGNPGGTVPSAPDRARPVAVKALVGTFFGDYSGDDGVALFIQFDTGQVATLHLTGHYAGAASYEAEYVCTRGMVRYGRDLLATNPDTPDDASYSPVPYEKHNGFARQLADVAGAIQERRPPLVPGEWGRLVQSVLLAAEESSRTGREVRLD